MAKGLFIQNHDYQLMLFLMTRFHKLSLFIKQLLSGHSGFKLSSPPPPHVVSSGLAYAANKGSKESKNVQIPRMGNFSHSPAILAEILRRRQADRKANPRWRPSSG